MAQLDPPHPPGRYPVVVIGSGPGGLQTSYCLDRLGIKHALISGDDAPGGMFRRFPIFQRLITWTKLHAPAERGSAAYEWFDWNSLLAEEPDARALVPGVMDGTSYFPSRPEMEAGIVEFAARTRIRCRYGVTWESTQRVEDGFVVTTSDGDYRCAVLVLAVGMAQPWKPDISGIEEVPHYVDLKEPQDYKDKRVFLIGKRNSAFELADGLLPWARRIILASPRSTRISVLTRSTAAARARYMQPYEDHVLGGGNLVLDSTIDAIEHTGDGYRVRATGTTVPGDFVLDVDAVVAATGFSVPLQDLRDLGVATFAQDRLPAQTPFWESATMPGIYFAGAATQGAIGLKKYGIPSNSAAVHGFRYNARVLARHIAAKHFGRSLDPPTIRPRDVVDHILATASHAADIWNQQSYLARVLERRDGAFANLDAQPLAHFVDSAGPDALAITIETDADGDIHPALYVRRDGRVEEHLLPSNPLRDYESAAYGSMVAGLFAGWI